MNAYLFKELRETARWLPLAWLIFAGLLYVALPQMSNLYLTQGLADRLVFQTAIGGSLVAFGLGLAQFMLDQRSSARAFLVHRSLTPSQLFRGKLLVGLGIYALGVGGPLMLLSAPSPTANVPIGWERRFILKITSIAIATAIGGTFVRKATRS